jgi:CheY-like chemotaxis protein
MSQGDHGAHSSSDRRRHFRAGVHGGAVVHGRGITKRGQITNLSLGGALIDLGEGSHEIPLDHEVVVELEIGGSGWVAQRGHVRRREARLVAVVWGPITPDIEDVIEDEVVAAMEARRSPRVVVVDPREDRRHAVAEKLRAAGCTSIEAATPLEAIALVEQSRNHVVAVAMAETLTQTGPHELVEFLSESNPNIQIAMFVEEEGMGPAARGSSPNVRRHGTSDELATALAQTLRRDRDRDLP